jgi:hypothetical protein
MFSHLPLPLSNCFEGSGGRSTRDVMGHIITTVVEKTLPSRSRHAGVKIMRPKNHNPEINENMADAKVLSNQKAILANQARIVNNQKSILSNQLTIVKNQKTLLANQGTIKKNQSALSEILKNQKVILAAIKK